MLRGLVERVSSGRVGVGCDERVYWEGGLRRGVGIFVCE